MEDLIDSAEVAIQGERVLRFINCTRERAIYEIIGFRDPIITVIDYRQAGLNAIQKLLRTGELYNFASEFNTPAKVGIRSDSDNAGNVLIELDEPGEEVPRQMLWIAIGLQDSVPAYDYLFELITELDDGTYGFVAVFDIPELDVAGHSVGFLGCEYSK